MGLQTYVCVALLRHHHRDVGVVRTPAYQQGNQVKERSMNLLTEIQPNVVWFQSSSSQRPAVLLLAAALPWFFNSSFHPFRQCGVAGSCLPRLLGKAGGRKKAQILDEFSVRGYVAGGGSRDGGGILLGEIRLEGVSCWGKNQASP